MDRDLPANPIIQAVLGLIAIGDAIAVPTTSASWIIAPSFRHRLDGEVVANGTHDLGMSQQQQNADWMGG